MQKFCEAINVAFAGSLLKIKTGSDTVSSKSFAFRHPCAVINIDK